MKGFSIRVVLMACAGMCVGVSHAQVVTQALMLSPGWQAYALTVTPEPVSECAHFFEYAPVDAVSCYDTEAAARTAQFTSDPSQTPVATPAFLIWHRGNEAASTLHRLSGANVYSSFNTNTWMQRVIGPPRAPRFGWRRAVENGDTLNYVAAFVRSNGSTTIQKYFQEGPFGTNGTAYRITGQHALGPYPEKIPNTSTLADGEALVLTAGRAGDWPGVLEVSPRDGLALTARAAAGSVSVRNRGTKARTVELRWETGRGTAVQALFGETEAMATWQPLDTLTRRLEPEELWTIRVRVRPEPGASGGGLLAFHDRDGGTDMQVRIPLTTDWSGFTVDEACWPAGLWEGEVTLTEVSTFTSDGGATTATEPLPAGGAMSMRLLLHVDTNGTAQLLQRVTMAGLAQPDGTLVQRPYLDEGSVASDATARRISSLVLDLAHPTVAATGGTGFGESLAFAWEVAADSKENPFRHALHPRHDGLDSDFKETLPTGNDPQNYMGAVKPELFGVSNRVDLVWTGDGGGTAWAADETAEGICTWRLDGLRHEGPVTARGLFRLRRISPSGRLY